MPVSYELDDGYHWSVGAGVLNRMSARVTSISVSDTGMIDYALSLTPRSGFDSDFLTGQRGALCRPAPGGSSCPYWTDSGLNLASSLTLRAQQGSATAYLSGIAEIAFSNPSSGWGGTPENFVGFAAPVGTLIHPLRRQHMATRYLHSDVCFHD